jgi:hypothetical protein
MPTMTPQSRIILSPDVTTLIFDPGPDGELARLWLRYLKGLIREEGFDLEDVVAPDVRCIDLELAGLPSGIAGLRQYRDRMTLLLPMMRVNVLHVVARCEPSTVEALIRVSPGEGRPVDDRAARDQTAWEVKTLARFALGRMIERWDRSDVTAIVAQRPVAI